MPNQGKSQKGWCNKPTKLQFQWILKHGKFDALQTLRINPSRPQNLATCAIGTLWSTSSDTHQVVEIQNEARFLLRCIHNFTMNYMCIREFFFGIWVFFLKSMNNYSKNFCCHGGKFLGLLFAFQYARGGVILFRPNRGVAPQKHDVITLAWQHSNIPIQSTYH